MGWINNFMPAIAMTGLQFTYAGISLSSRPAMLQGLNPRVLIVYRHLFATLAIAPIAYFSRTKSTNSSLGLRSFFLIFFASFIGVTLNQNLFFEGMYFASSSTASAMANLVPAITFVMAYVAGIEKIQMRSMRSIAKIFGTLLCVAGAIFMALLRGPKLLNSDLVSMKSIFSSGQGNWLLGCLFLLASCCCWSLWLILQVPLSASCPDYLSLSAWCCFFVTLQSAATTLCVERDPEAWILKSKLEWFCCLYSGIIGSAFSFVVQTWCISKKGPLFSAMFNPLCTVIVTTAAALFLHEEIYSGSLVGGIAVTIGLYVVLWGKAKDSPSPEVEDESTDPKSQIDGTTFVQVSIEESFEEKLSCEFDLDQPLLDPKPITST